MKAIHRWIEGEHWMYWIEENQIGKYNKSLISIGHFHWLSVRPSRIEECFSIESLVSTSSFEILQVCTSLWADCTIKLQPRKQYSARLTAEGHNWSELQRMQPSPPRSKWAPLEEEIAVCLEGDGAGDAWIDDAVGVVQQPARLLLAETVHRCAQRPLHHGGDEERHHAQRGTHDLAATRVLPSPALHAQRNRHRSLALSSLQCLGILRYPSLRRYRSWELQCEGSGKQEKELDVNCYV